LTVGRTPGAAPQGLEAAQGARPFAWAEKRLPWRGLLIEGNPADPIDRCQNHVMAGSRVRRHCLHHAFADEKKAARERLGQRIDFILVQPGTA
jgi:hypothetical protein